MNPFYSNTPDIKNQMHIDLFINRDSSLELSRTLLVGEILWEIPHEPGAYRLNPLYWQAIKQQTTSQ